MTMPDDSSLDELAAGVIDDADARILAAVANLYSTLDPVPVNLIERIQFGITLDALHAELADLQRSHTLAGVRSDDAGAQTVTFTSSSLTAMVTITETSADSARLDGWITPGGVAVVELRTVSSVLSTEADVDGRFVFAEVARGLVQLTIRTPGSERAVITPSMEI
jgi:hypothetical protein